MANSKSAEKRIRVNQKKRERNVAYKSALRTTIKRYENALAEDPSAAPAHLQKAIKALDKAASKGIIHKNAAARKKSRLTRNLAKQA
ncbi:MAG: 30S ribosomal protein S20 [Bacillota bacterium]|nr:30S ribosomal protein S20 [Bacillota bacterium]HHU61811.1 30S ribosomal protein S20 [Natronincola sp.]